MRTTRLLFALLLGASFSGPIAAQTAYTAKHKTELLKSGYDSKKIRFNFSDPSFSPVSINGQEFVRIQDNEGVMSNQKGHPNLVKFETSILLEATGGSSYEIVDAQYKDYENILLAPGKGPLKRNVNPADIPFTFADIYNKNEFYPTNIIHLGDPYILRDLRGQNVHITPYQYNAVTKVLRVYTSVTVELKKNPSLHVNELKHSGNEITPEFNEIYKHKFINYSSKRYTPVGEKGSMLVICPDNLLSTVQPLLDWKMQKGIPVKVVNTDATGATQESIFQYVKNYFSQNENMTYLLIVGDHDQVVSYNLGQTMDYETKWSDSKYGLLNGDDHYPEIFVGRLSAENTAQLKTVVDRTLEYEKTPSQGTWYKNAIGLGSDEGDGSGDEGEADWQHLRNIRGKLLNYTYAKVHEFYDGSQGEKDAAGNPQAQDIQTAVNAGISLFNYTGHGDLTTCITGNYSSTEINAATNNGMYPVVISVACNNGTFTEGTCISEDWIRASNDNGPTGAIAAAGSSILMAWAPPMATQDEMTDILIESYANNIKRTIGGVFYNGQMKMLDKYPQGEGPEVVETWVMFGDPSVMMRTDVPQQITAQHDASVGVGEQSFTVSGINADGAIVCITHNNEILGKATVANGTATINLKKATEMGKSLLVTISGYNKIPYQQSVNVGATSFATIHGKQFRMYPNPADAQLTIELSDDTHALVSIVNNIGQVVYNNQVSNTNRLQIEAADLHAGIYYVSVNQNGAVSTKKLLIK